ALQFVRNWHERARPREPVWVSSEGRSGPDPRSSGLPKAGDSGSRRLLARLGLPRRSVVDRFWVQSDLSRGYRLSADLLCKRCAFTAVDSILRSMRKLLRTS